MKNAFLGQKRKKFKKMKKADPNYFSILHRNMSPNFFRGPPGLRKLHYLLILLVSEVLTHTRRNQKKNQPAIFCSLDLPNG